MNLHRITAYAVAGLLALPGAVFAQDATDAYSDGGDVVETVAEPTPTVAAETESAAPAPAATEPKELARTGGDEIIIALGGLMLLGSGVAMRRMSR